MERRGPGRGMRVGALLFVAATVLVAVVLVVAAFVADGPDRDGFIGIAILWGAGALAAVALLLALERRRG